MKALTEIAKTMSSVEIAELTGKRHDNVMADIDKMLKELDIRSPEFLGEQTFANNRKRKVYNLPKRECTILVSGYSVKMRAAIIDRWQELEAQSTKLSRIEILQLAMDAEQEAIALKSEVETMKPDVLAFERIAKADGSMCMRDAAKSLQLRPKDLKQWMIKHKWIYQRPSAKYFLGYESKIKPGYLEHKTTLINVGRENERTSIQVRVMPKGLARLSKLV